MTRIVHFVYQGAIHKGCLLLNHLLIAYLLCKTAYATHTGLNLQDNNPRNPCHPRKSAIQTKKVSILGFHKILIVVGTLRVPSLLKKGAKNFT